MANDNWRTPKALFDTLNNEFNFIADIASSDNNKLCELNLTESNSAFDYDFSQLEMGGALWCNPPYSNVQPWIDLAIKNQSLGLFTVMLLNQDTSVKWFCDAVAKVNEIRFITGYYKNGKYHGGRIAFIDDNDKAVSGNNKPQFILIFYPFSNGLQKISHVPKNVLMGE